MAQSQQPPQRSVPRPAPAADETPPAETAEQRRERAAAEEKATRDQAEAATAHLGRPGAPAPPLSPTAVGAPDEPTVKMNFRHVTYLTLPGYRLVRFEAGIQDVPESIADDPYLAASGAVKV